MRWATINLMPADMLREIGAAALFLSNNRWPYHKYPDISYSDAYDLLLESRANSLVFWVCDHFGPVGLIRILDVDDMNDGAPLLDVRIATSKRGVGIGTHAVKRAIDLLFKSYSNLRRLEAMTRSDNIAMQRVLAKAGFLLEGRLRQSWMLNNGKWADTLVYGLIRNDIDRRYIMSNEHDDSTADEQPLMVRHNRPILIEDLDGGPDIELTVRHNRPAPEGAAELMVRHNRPISAMEGEAVEDYELTLMVRHTRPMEDLDIELTVRHARPIMAGDDAEHQSLDVRHNRPMVSADDSDDVELSIRHTRPID